MNNLSLILAWRYLIGSSKEKSISAMLVVCFAGILIGSFALALVASVMNGFEKVTHEKMQGIHSQIMIHADGQLIDTQKIGKILNNEFPEIVAFSPSDMQQAIIQNKETEEIHSVVAIKGIDPIGEPTISTLEKKIISSSGSSKKLSAILGDNRVLIGETLAEIIAVGPGEPISLFVNANSSMRGAKIKLKRKEALVGGIFKIGIDEFDSGFIFCSLPFLKKLFPESDTTQIGLRLKPGTAEQATISALHERLGITVQSWKDLYPALVSALKLEKYAMFFILALITLVASMNIISLMFMQIIRKRADIAILKAMGMADTAISRTFLFIGMGVAALGCFFGLVCAFIVGWILEHYPFITLPDAYYVSHLPSRMTIPIFITVFVVVMTLSFISTWLTTRRTKNINVSHVLRFEG